MSINYPYLPEGRSFQYVSVDHPWMLEAAKARAQCAGDSLFPVGAVLVKDGQLLARAGNGFNRGAGHRHICPRVVFECPSGTGYDLCSLHDAPGHAEPMVIEAAQKLGHESIGADMYLFGHWWCCEPCWDAMIQAGIQDVYVTDDAHERFNRDRVWAETLQPSVHSAYIAGSLTGLTDQTRADKHTLYEALGAVCEALGCRAVIPHRNNHENIKPTSIHRNVYDWATQNVRDTELMIAEVSDPSLGVGGEIELAKQLGKPIVLLSHKGAKVSRFVLGNPAVVYHIEYETIEQACRMLAQVIRQC